MNNVNIAVVGAGYWGSNLVRNHASLGSLHTVCDTDENVLADMKQEYPRARHTDDLDEVLSDPEIDGVCLVTPAATHVELGKRVLEAGKHLYVEKPLAFSAEDGRELIDKSERAGKTLMTGHIMVYHPVVNELQERIDDGQLGKINYLYSTRVNLGTVRPDANVLWNLAIHDIAVMLEIIDSEPVTVSTNGRDFLQDGIADVAFLTIYFGSGQLAHLHASWLDPHKVRKLTVVGEEKMAVFEDTRKRHPLAIHDKSAQKNGERSDKKYPGFGVTTESDDTLLPAIDSTEPLLNECREFVEAIDTGKTPKTGGSHALDVIRVLEAADASLENQGEKISLNTPGKSPVKS